MNSSIDCVTRSVPLEVRPPSQCNGWSLHFRDAGWRIFYRNVVPDGSALYWLFKRDSSVFLLKQLPRSTLTFCADLPEAHADEICALMAASHLATPAK